MSSSPAQLTISRMTAADWPAVARIYEAGIAGGNATFELAAPDWERWRQAHVEELCLVARGPAVDADGVDELGGADELDGADEPGGLLGWAALGRGSTRAVYRGVAEVSIYVDPQHASRGVGRALLQGLIDASEQAGFWTLDAGIFPENTVSIALHESCGFRFRGVRERVGQMPDGRWRDVWMYERRSALVGHE